MAPLTLDIIYGFKPQRDDLRRWRRDGAGASTSTNPSLYLGLGLGVGGAILIAIILVTVQIVKKRKDHRRMIEALEVEQAVRAAQGQETSDFPRPMSVHIGGSRRSRLAPFHPRAGWGALSSNETVNEPNSMARRKRSSVSLPRKFKQNGIQLKRLKRLTAIMESPRSRSTNSPRGTAMMSQESISSQPVASRANIDSNQNHKTYTLRKVDDEDVFMCPGSPKVDVLPSFAIRSPGRYGAGIANNDNTKTSRSRSVGALEFRLPQKAMLRQAVGSSRPPMHVRSFSLDAPGGRPPSCPVPPLPVIDPHTTENEPSVRQGLCVSRSSCSSQESASSSLLVTSPILTKMHQQNKILCSPSVEQVVAEDDSASLKTVSTKQWKRPLATKPRPIGAHDRNGSKSQASIRSNTARYSVESLASHRLSSTSASSPSERKGHHRVSIPQIGAADQTSISRVSSVKSFNSHTGSQKVTPPRKASRSSVSVTGSPAERKRTSVLRDISGNSSTTSRRPSNTTQDSNRSSNGNPFQWDQPLPKPSALKGSPNARKGHRRQNCVRISTLTPQILGPPPSRPNSPNIMHGIEEESGDGEDAMRANNLRFVSNQRFSRPLSASSFAPNLRVSTLRASLTPSSPTLSAWNMYQEHGLPSQASDSQLSASSEARSRSISRQSDCSSNLSIPSFPSPIRATVSGIQLNQPVPQFSLSRPSADIDEDASASSFGSRIASDPDLPSSPTLAGSRRAEYDPAHPAWPAVNIPAPERQEYDPASPAWDTTEPEKSSPFFPFAARSMSETCDERSSPQSRSQSYGSELLETPPCSPKTIPEGFLVFFDKQGSGSTSARAAEKLTSANASAMMASVPSQTVDFPGAPILPPPEETDGYIQPRPSRLAAPRQRAASSAVAWQPTRPAPPPPFHSIPSSDYDVPSPLHLSGKTSPRGPRSQPAHSVLKNAMALRRMNSEVNCTPHRESRTYVRLGREASPLLPWIGSRNPNESCGDMNELFDFGFASAGAESSAEGDRSALDQIDMAEVERKLDGALAGFQASSNGTSRKQKNRQSSVWEDGEKYWQPEESPRKPILSPKDLCPSPLRVETTPKKEASCNYSLPVSIQNTPKSLYDSDGFLNT